MPAVAGHLVLNRDQQGACVIELESIGFWHVGFPNLIKIKPMKKVPRPAPGRTSRSPGKKTTPATGKVKNTVKKPLPRGRVRLALDDRRSQLLALGVAAFAARSYEAVSIEEIANEAGISRGLLFHYFPSKRDFYVAAIEVMAAQMLEETFVQAPAGQSAAELVSLLGRGLDAYFGYVENRAEAFATLLRAGGESGGQEVVEATRREFVRRIRAYLPAQAAGNEALLRASLSGWERFVEGVALDWIEHRDLPRSARVELAVRAALVLPGLA